MSARRHSRTAEGVAAVRAAESLLYPPEDRVFADPIARDVASARMRLLLRTGRLLRALAWCNARRYHGVVYEVVVRARYAKERLDRLASHGVRQAVILGAGFDPTAWLSGLPEDLVVYEVDRAETQRLKRRRLTRAGILEPARLVFIPLDLGGGDLGGALASAGFRGDRPACVTLLGVLAYLPRTVVEAVLRDLGGLLAPGSELVYSCFARAALDPERSPAGLRRIARRLARLGEPSLFAADPLEMADMVGVAGMTQVENLAGDRMTARYLARAGGGIRVVSPCLNLARAEK